MLKGSFTAGVGYLTDHALPELQERSTLEPRRKNPLPLAASLQHFLLTKINTGADWQRRCICKIQLHLHKVMKGEF